MAAVHYNEDFWNEQNIYVNKRERERERGGDKDMHRLVLGTAKEKFTENSENFVKVLFSRIQNPREMLLM